MPPLSTATAAAALALSVLLGLSACGEVAERAAREGVENGIGRATGDDDVHLPGAGTTPTATSPTTPTAAPLPAGFPADVPLPEGTVVSAHDDSTDEYTRFGVELALAGDQQRALARVVRHFRSHGFTLTQRAGDASVLLTGKRWLVTVAVLPSPRPHTSAASLGVIAR